MPYYQIDRFFYDEGLLSSEQLTLISERRAQTGDGFITTVLAENLLPYETISAVLARHALIDICDLTGLALEADTAKALGYFYSEQYAALPVACENGRLWVAMRDPFCERTLAGLRDLTGLFIEPMLAREADIRYYVNAVFGSERIHDIASQFLVEGNIQKAHLSLDAEQKARIMNAPAVRLIDSLIESAALYRASDIHIEPYEHHLRARYRVDGILTVFQEVDISLLPNIISRLKVMGGMDIAEKRLPQDGHFTLILHGEAVDFRLSTLPTLYGEKAVIRLLYDRSSRLKKDELGFFQDDLARLTQLFKRPYGAVFMTGPTGSGKSTTLNSFLAELNTDAVNIVTVEDPVENPLAGVNHMNVEPAAGLTFANALRHILRQDPDIVMIGEIRDAETAKIAIQAAITGHLVLSTLHTNDAAGVLERLIDMGVEPYLAAAALNGVISQRLVRRICPYCKRPKPLTPEESQALVLPPDTPAYAGEGCGRCNYTGYKGRLALYEYLIMDETLRRRMSADAARFAARLRRARAGVRVGMHENALRNLREGRTTAAEIFRVLNCET